MNLPEYIKTIGNKAASTLFGASIPTVKSWRYGYRRPTPDVAKRIIAATGGKVGWDEIYPDAKGKDAA